MTKNQIEKRPTAYQEAVALGKKLRSISTRADSLGKETRPSIRNDLEASLKKDVYSYMPEQGRPAKAQDLSEAGLREGIGYATNRLAENVGAIFSTRLDDLVESMPDEQAEKVLFDKDVLAGLKPKYRQVVATYSAMNDANGLIQRFSKGEQMSKEEQKLVLGLAAEGASQKAEESMRKSEEHSEAFYRGTRAIVASNIERGLVPMDKIKDYALKGLKSQYDKMKEDFDEMGVSVVDVAKERITEMAKSNDPQVYNKVRDLVLFS